MYYLGNRCKFAEDCPRFSGEEKTVDTPLAVFRNVFCNRGMKGWKNCDRYNKLNEENTN